MDTSLQPCVSWWHDEIFASIRCVGLTLSLFIERLFWVNNGKASVKNGHQKDSHYMEIEWLCSQSRHHSRFYSDYLNWEGLCDHLKRKGIFTLISYNLCISTRLWNLKWQSSLFRIANWMRQYLSRPNGPKCLQSWKRVQKVHTLRHAHLIPYSTIA